jgi:alkanesulfonate monooxygenase SsuD/methylene tetrahydromethanopterin reductase-like flavin-dependent oxidoreductase (luciferase family)
LLRCLEPVAGLEAREIMDGRVEFGIYVPQLGFEYDEVLARARLCEELGFSSLWLFDHLYPPELPDVPAFEGWTLASALLASTTRLRVGHLVLCNSFRPPALLARMATTLDVISSGRLELGMGSGSYEPEHHRAGIPWGSFADRSLRLGEALEIITRMFASPTTTFEGQHYQVHDLPNLPPPTQRPRPPIHVGGAGERWTLPLVARYADVWNLPTYAANQFERKRSVLLSECERIGRDPASIRCSQEAVLAIARDQAELETARATAERRFPGPGWGLHEGGYIGTPPAIVDKIGERLEQGITSFVFFTHDRAAEATLRLIAEEVVPQFA